MALGRQGECTRGDGQMLGTHPAKRSVAAESGAAHRNLATAPAGRGAGKDIRVSCSRRAGSDIGETFVVVTFPAGGDGNEVVKETATVDTGTGALPTSWARPGQRRCEAAAMESGGLLRKACPARARVPGHHPGADRRQAGRR